MPQVSSSLALVRGALRAALPVAGSMVQWMPRRSSKWTTSPSSPPWPAGTGLGCRPAQATCAEPGPWQASQPTPISAQVVA